MVRDLLPSQMNHNTQACQTLLCNTFERQQHLLFFDCSCNDGSLCRKRPTLPKLLLPWALNKGRAITEQSPAQWPARSPNQDPALGGHWIPTCAKRPTEHGRGNPARCRTYRATHGNLTPAGGRETSRLPNRGGAAQLPRMRPAGLRCSTTREAGKWREGGWVGEKRGGGTN